MENLERNLRSLKSEYHDKGKAFRGYNNIFSYIDNKKNKELDWLLRNHVGQPVYGQELIERFEIDALIEFYNLLLIGAVAGYIPSNFGDELNTEIVTVLSHPSVQPYYQTYYPYKITEYTLQYASSGRFFEQQPTITSISSFHDFLSQNRTLKTDKDLERFIGMLDHVWYNDETIDDIIKVLSSYPELNKAITAKEKHEKEKGVWGFFKYTVFLSQFKELLMETDSPLMQSAMWLFHGYYFDRMNIKMKSFFNQAFDNIETALTNPKLFTNIASELYGENVPEGFDEKELEEYASAAVEQSRQDVLFVLNEEWKVPLKNFFETNK
jgi:hypothetical protein